MCVCACVREQHLYSHDTSEDMHRKLTEEWGDASTHHENYFIKNGQKQFPFWFAKFHISSHLYHNRTKWSQYSLKRVNTKL